MNQPRWSDKWTVLHVAAMVGAREVTRMLLQAGANTTLLDEDGRTAAQLANGYGFTVLSDTINMAPKHWFKHETHATNRNSSLDQVQHGGNCEVTLFKLLLNEVTLPHKHPSVTT